MGVSTSVAQFTGKLDKLASELKDVQKPLEATALRGKEIFLSTAAAAGVIGAKPAGKRKMIGARYDTKNKKSQGLGEGSIVITYTGPAHLVNSPTRAHEIRPRRRPGVRTRRKQAARALTINSDLRAIAHHPGTKGKHFFERAKALCEVALPRVYAAKQITEPLRRTFH
jgi:hypothetical protein